MTSVRPGGGARSPTRLAGADCPRAVVEALLKCLEPMPEDRHHSAGELARELDLCLQPRAHALLHTRRGWRAVLKRHPVRSTILFGLIPNMIMCALNIAFNKKQIVDRLSADDQRAFFSFRLRAST